MKKVELKHLYRLVDYYEGAEIVGKFDTLNEATKAATQRALDTDGECSLELQEMTINVITDWTYPDPKEWGRQ